MFRRQLSLLAVSTLVVVAGAVVIASPGSAAADPCGALPDTPGLTVDNVDAGERSISFDISGGWSYIPPGVGDLVVLWDYPQEVAQEGGYSDFQEFAGQIRCYSSQVAEEVIVVPPQTLAHDYTVPGAWTACLGARYPNSVGFSFLAETFFNADGKEFGDCVGHVLVPPSTGDSDGDGVSDAVDACPETPTGTAVDPDGCAAAVGRFSWHTVSPASFEVGFDASASTGSGITGYAWDFGDGSTVITSGPSTTHVYAATGDKHVSVTPRTTGGFGQAGTATVPLSLIVQPDSTGSSGLADVTVTTPTPTRSACPVSVALRSTAPLWDHVDVGPTAQVTLGPPATLATRAGLLPPASAGLNQWNEVCFHLPGQSLLVHLDLSNWVVILAQFADVFLGALFPVPVTISDFDTVARFVDAARTTALGTAASCVVAATKLNLAQATSMATQCLLQMFVAVTTNRAEQQKLLTAVGVLGNLALAQALEQFFTGWNNLSQRTATSLSQQLTALSDAVTPQNVSTINELFNSLQLLIGRFLKETQNQLTALQDTLGAEQQLRRQLAAQQTQLQQLLNTCKGGQCLQITSRLKQIATAITTVDSELANLTEQIAGVQASSGTLTILSRKVGNVSAWLGLVNVGITLGQYIGYTSTGRLLGRITIEATTVQRSGASTP